MADATALLSDGLDLLAEFLASSRAVDDDIVVTYGEQSRWHATATELACWSDAGTAGANDLVLDQAGLCIRVSPGFWNRLYAGALATGRAVPPDRTGVATRGVGGMLAELSRVPDLAGALLGGGAEVLMDDGEDEPWLLLPWPPLKALLLRDRLLVQEAMRPRPLLGAMPASAAGLAAAVRRHGLLLGRDGEPMQLLCPRAWSARMAGELGRHFTESVLLLFRLMFYSPDQGWGWDAASNQCAGLVALMDDAGQAGLADFGGLRDSCAMLASAIGAGGDSASCAMPMVAAVRELAALWPADYLQAGHHSCMLMAGWMTRVHPDAQIAPDALLGPGVVVGRACTIGAGAVLKNCAGIAPCQTVPPGVVIAANAKVERIALSGNKLPPGTLLHGSLVLYRNVSIGKQVSLGADAEIGFDVAIPNGVTVAANARVRLLRLADNVRLPAGTVIEGDLRVDDDVRLGRDLRLGDNVVIQRGATIGNGVHLPRRVVVAAGACVQCCTLGKGASLGAVVTIFGDLTLEPRAGVGAWVSLGANAVIGAGVVVPAAVKVMHGAHIAMLKLHGCQLPVGTVLGGNLRLGRRCVLGSGIVFEGENHIASDLHLPANLRIARGARIRKLNLEGVALAPGTVVCGNATALPGTRIERGVKLEAGVVVTAASLPPGVTVMRNAIVRRCDVTGATLPKGTRIGGSLYLAPGVRIGANVQLRERVSIRCVCEVPESVEFLAGAIVHWFEIAPGVVLPPGTRIAGSLCLEPGVVVGASVTSGACAIVKSGVRIPNGAQLGRGARISRLNIAHSVTLPDDFTLSGDAVIGAGATIGKCVVLGDRVDIGAGVMLPPGVTLVDHAQIDRLCIADGVALPPGTSLCGNLILRRGVQVGQRVKFGAEVDIGPHVVVPDGVAVAPGAIVRVLSAAAGVLPGRDVFIAGDFRAGAGAVVAPHVYIGAGVVLEGGCRIGSGVVLPAGVIVTRNARLDCLDIAADVRLPPGTRIDGDLRIAAGARIGRNVCLGKGVRIGPGAVLGDNAVVCAGAIIGSHACVAAGAVVGAAMHVGDGEQVRCEPPAADADFNTWQVYLSGNLVPADAPQPQPQPRPQPGPQPQPLTPAMPPPSAPINIPAEVLRPLRGNAPLPRPYT